MIGRTVENFPETLKTKNEIFFSQMFLQFFLTDRASYQLQHPDKSALITINPLGFRGAII